MPSCYIKKNMDWQGGDTHKKDGVYSMGECQDWCRQKDSKHFVWAKTFCVCKDAVTGERSSNCCDSGEATGCSGTKTFTGPKIITSHGLVKLGN